MMPSGAVRGPRLPFLAWAALPVLLAAWLRLREIGTPEPFVDEGANILTALDARVRVAFEPLSQGRPWLVYAFAPAGAFPDHVLEVARVISAACGLTTMAALGWTLFRISGRAAALGGLWLWAVLPMAVFHERLALQDPMVTAALAGCAALLTTATGSTIPSTRRLWYLGAGVLFGAAFLLKISALFALPWLALLIAGLRRQRPELPWIQGSGWFAIGLLIPIATLGRDIFELGSHLGRYGALPGLNEASVAASGLDRLQAWLGWYAGYGGWPLALFLATAIVTPISRPASPARSVGAGWLVTLLVSGAFYNNSYARYALPDHVPLVLSLALTAGLLLDGTNRPRQWLAFAIMTLGLGRWTWISARLGSDPLHASIPHAEVVQYFTGPWAGGGTRAVRDFLAGHADRTGTRSLVLTHQFLRPGCYALMLAERADPRIGVVPFTIYEPSELATARSALEHASGTAPVSFFLLYEGSLYPAPAWLDRPGSPARRVLVVDRGGGEEFVLFRIEREVKR
jgi:hypothetical protein